MDEESKLWINRLIALQTQIELVENELLIRENETETILGLAHRLPYLLREWGGTVNELREHIENALQPENGTHNGDSVSVN